MATTVAKVTSPDRIIQQMQNNIVTPLNTLLAAPLVNGSVLSSVSLVAGDNTINHLLSRRLIGWIIVRSRAVASIFDKQDTNTIPDKTLILNSSAPAVVDIFVF